MNRNLLNRFCGAAIFFMALLVSTQTWSQSWTFRNGFGQAGAGFADLGKAACTDASGNVYITGKISDALAGNTVNFGTGALVSAGDDDGFVAKFNSAGTCLWAIRFGGTSFVDLGEGIATDGTSVYVTGAVNGAMTVGTSATSYPAASAGIDGFVMKLDAATGATTWVTRFGGGNTDEGQAITLDPAGNIYVSGIFRTRSTNPTATFGTFTPTVQGNTASYTSDLFVAKLNTSGVFQWVSTGGIAGSNDNINGSGVCYVPSLSEVVVVGNFRTNGTSGTTATYGSLTLTNSGLATNEDFCLLELNASTGAFGEALSAGSADGNEAGLGITYDAFTGDVFFCGYFSSASVTFPGSTPITNASSTHDNILYGRYNPASNVFGWIKDADNSVPSSAGDEARAITSNGIGGILITGNFRNSVTFPGASALNAASGQSDIFLVKVNASNGTATLATQGSGTSGTADDIGYGIAYTASTGAIWITGQYASSITFSPLAALASAGGTEDILLAQFTDPPPAVVTSVGVPANGTYKIGDNLNFTVNWDKNVTVNTAGGTPFIPITIGATVRNAVYISGSGTSALVFRYTVVSGDADNNGITVGSAITANGGTIRNTSTTVDANLTLNSVASTTGVLVDGVAPTVSSINRQNPAGPPTNATSVVYRVNFSESVSNVDITDFVLTTTGTATGNIASVSASSGSTIDVTVNSVSGNGTLRLDLKASGTGIVDAVGNPISGGFTSGQAYTIDNTTQAPTLTSPAASTLYHNPITISATLPEVPLSGSVKLSFNNGSTTVTLTLVDATSYNFSLNVNNPTASPQVASSTASFIPYGTHTVTLSYQDALGNPAATDPNASVTISPALPLTLLDFNLNKQGKNCLVQWTTSNEINTDRFEIEQSSDGVHFAKAGVVNAAGSNNGQQQYSFIHTQPLKGWNYYRLKMVDVGESFTYSAIKRITFEDKPGVIVYPKPASDRIHLSYDLSGVKEISIVDAGGRTLIRKQDGLNDTNASLDVSALSKGMYYVRIVYAGGVVTEAFSKTE